MFLNIFTLQYVLICYRTFKFKTYEILHIKHIVKYIFKPELRWFRCFIFKYESLQINKNNMKRLHKLVKFNIVNCTK